MNFKYISLLILSIFILQIVGKAIIYNDVVDKNNDADDDDKSTNDIDRTGRFIEINQTIPFPFEDTVDEYHVREKKSSKPLLQVFYELLFYLKHNIYTPVLIYFYTYCFYSLINNNKNKEKVS